MGDELNANAEAPQTQTGSVDPQVQTGEVQTQQVDSGQHEKTGFQTRIDELTAKRYAAERRAEEISQQKDAQIAQLLEMVNRTAVQQQTATPDPLADLAPEQRQLLENYKRATIDPVVKALQTELSQLKTGFQTQQAMQYVASKAAPTDSPAVVQKAQELMAYWTRSGASGWIPEDALVYARGLLGTQAPVQQPRAQNGQFMQSSQNVMSGQAAPPAPVSRVNQGLPADIEQRPLDEQIALFEKHLDGKQF